MARSKKKQVQEEEDIDIVSDDEILDFDEVEEDDVVEEDIKDDDDDDEDTPDNKKNLTEYNDEEEDDLITDDNEYNDFDITEQEMKTQTYVTVPPDKRITKPVLNKYERARLLATRTKQLSLGAKPLVKIESKTPLPPYEIALHELKEKIIPLIIKRVLPSGKIELWKMDELTDIYG
jgi:DNA-directed RNA polymerases I, II, and III subunit RPABC2